MKMDELVQGFMVDLDVDSKNGSVAGHSIDMCLRLVAPEYNAKPWNKKKQFLQFLDESLVQLQRQQVWLFVQGSSSAALPLGTLEGIP